MADAVSIPASEVKETLRKEGISVTFKALSEVFSMPVSGTTELLGSLDEIKARIIAAKTSPQAPVVFEPTPEPSQEEALSPRKAPAKRGPRKASANRGGKSLAQVTTSNRPPRVKRTLEGVQAATDLIRLLEGWPVPEAFPTDLQRFKRNGVAMIRGTTVDGVVYEGIQSEALKSLERRDELSFAIPLFSDGAASKIVTTVSMLDGAPGESDLDGNGIRLFRNRNAWYFNLLQVGIRIWAGLNNPPSLDLKEFPHREFQSDGVTPVEWAVFRYRPVMLGWVAKVLEAFEEESILSGLTGTALREFRANWVNQFINRERNVVIGDVEKSFADFRGKPEEFRLIWETVVLQTKERESALIKRSPTNRRTRKGA